MMPNLITELTPRYCNEMLSGAMFMYKGDAHLYGSVEEGQNESICRRIVGTPDKMTSKTATVPNDHFQGWGTLEFPILGYRTVGGGQGLAYLMRRNSVRRGLTAEDTVVEWHDVTYQCRDHMGFNTNHYMTANGRTAMVMYPEYTTLNEGLAKVFKGEAPSFALSAAIAVAPSREVPFLEVLYRRRRIGTIDENGKIEITAKNMMPIWNHTTKDP